MPTVIWTIVALASVFLLRNFFIRYLMTASILFTGSQKLGKILYVAVFFPGVVIHELSHFFVACLLGVRTGTFEIFPRETQATVSLGSLKVAKTDFIRNACIGAAPLFVGLLLMVTIARLIFPFTLEIQSVDIIIQTLCTNWSSKILVYFYLLFAISNTMALSKSDREGLLPMLATLASVGFIAVISPKASTLLGIFQETVTTGLNSLAVALTFVFSLNLVCFSPLYILVKLGERIRKKKIKALGLSK